MSNQNRNNTPANGQVNNGQNAASNGQQTKKETFIGKILKTRDKIMASKAGRIVVRGLKVAGVGGLAFASYKAGAKSVKPTTIYIREGVTEEETPVETQETVDMETGEVTTE